MTIGGSNTFQFSGGNVVEGCQGDGFSTASSKSPLEAEPLHNPSDNSSNASRGGEGVEPAEFRIAHKQSTTAEVERNHG